MLEIDLTVSIVSVIALAAIISPVIVALLNNHHLEKMKRLEIISNHKFAYIENYLSATGKYLTHDSPANFSDYGKARGMIYLYIPKRSWHAIDKLDKLIEGNNLDEANAYFPEVCKELSKAVK